MGRRSRLLAVDWFYGSDHDLVVNTGSMSRRHPRAPRAARASCATRAPRVTHFNYFANPSRSRWMVDGLARDDADDGGFLPIEQAKQEAAALARGGAREPRRDDTAADRVVVPGTMGSALNSGGRRGLARRTGRCCAAGWATSAGAPADVEVGRAARRFLRPAARAPGGTHRVEICPYDWRQSVRDGGEGARRARSEAVLPDAERTQQPVHIVAHSMGGLVARSMIADGGAAPRSGGA